MRTPVALILALSLAGCDDDGSSGGGEPDAESAPDAAAADAAPTADATPADAATPDAALPDAAPAECAPGAVEPCGGEAIGRCRPGARTCDAAGRWSPCEGAVGPAEETCDGTDEDCDGVTDDVAPRVATTVVAAASHPGELVGLAADGDELAVAWSDTVDEGGRVLRFARLAAAGPVIGEPVEIDRGAPWSPTIRWTGRAWAVAWSDTERGVLFALRAPDGVPLVVVRPVGLPGPAEAPSLASTGDGFGLLWHDSAGRDWFRALDADGTPSSPEPFQLQFETASVVAALTWTGQRFIGAFSEGVPGMAHIVVRAPPTDGLPMDASDRNHNAEYPALATREGRTSLAWFDEDRVADRRQILLADLDFEGRPSGGPWVVAEGATWGDLAWGAAGRAVAFNDGNERVGFVRVTDEGTPDGEPVTLAAADVRSYVRLVATETGFAAAWFQGPEGQPTLNVARVATGCP